MKFKLLFVFLLCSAIGKTNAQSKLTNRDIYAFDSGDVFHIESWVNSGPSEFLKRTILTNANYLAGVDSVYYLVADTILSYNGTTHNFDSSYNVHVISYSYLDSFPKSNDQGPGPFAQYLYTDSFQVNMCNDTTFFREFRDKAKDDTTITDIGVIVGLFFYKGIGSYYHWSESGGGPVMEYYNELRYYKKRGKECGKRFTVGLQEASVENELLKIYPNPINDHIRFSKPINGTYEIYSCKGELMQKGEMKEEIPVKLVEGVYLIRIVSSGKSQTIRFLK